MGATINDIQNARPYMEYGNGPLVWEFFDDFNTGLDNNTTTGLGRWFFLETAAGATETIDYAGGGAFGVLKLLQTTNDNDVISMQANSGILTSSAANNLPIRFGCRFQVADADDVDASFGLAIQDTSIAASAPADFVLFQIAEGSAALKLVASKDSVTQSATGIVTVADATWVRAFFEFWPITGNQDSGILYYTVHSNGSKVTGNITLSNTWPDDVLIVPTIQVQNGSVDADANYVDWIYASCARADYTDGTG